ncbi:MAG: hypothetical protein OEV00_05835 [Acidobacteriota bacterium]|nr:hypothetical protein [Acidobacteriota bacterium]MDH3784835.1 hypothetical protein [Acidobacteriota bacterium]
MESSASASGWLISGFFAAVGLWVWVGVVVAHGLWRSIAQSEPNAIRGSGPIEPDAP